MVTVIDYHVRESKKGESFTTLTLQGDLEMIMSQSSGKYYATARKASIITTFHEDACKTLIGTTFPGRIEKKPVDKPYDYQIPYSITFLLPDTVFSALPVQSLILL